MPRREAVGHRLFHEDEEAAALWRRIAGLPDSRIVRIATVGQLLAHGRHRAVRAVLGDFLRPRRAPSPAVRRAARTRTATGSSRSGTWSSCSSRKDPPGTRVPLPRPSASTPAWDSSAFAAVHAGQTRQLRHRPDAGADPGQRGGDRAGSVDGPFKTSHRVDRRPSAQHVVPDRRRRAALQRGPRLRAAPDHAPGHAAFAHDGHQGGHVPQAGPRPGAPDGRRLPRPSCPGPSR